MKRIATIAVALVLAGCDAAPSTESASPTNSAPIPAVAEVHPADREWNMADADGFTNGNVGIAVAKHLRGDEFPEGNGALTDVMKSPWNYYGKRMCFSGKVAQVEDVPPDNELAVAFGGAAAEVIVVSGDSIVDVLVIGGSGSVLPGQRINACGLVAGRTEVPNRIGGTFRHLIMVAKLKPPAEPKAS